MRKAIPIVLLALAAVGVFSLFGRGDRRLDGTDVPVGAEPATVARSAEDDARDAVEPLRRETVEVGGPAASSSEKGWAFRTVREDGAVVPDVPLVVWRSTPSGERALMWTGRTDDRGVARVGFLAARAARARRPGARYAVAPTVLAATPVATVIDPDVPPDEPFDVVVPATVPVEVELVDANDRAVPLPVTFRLCRRDARALHPPRGHVPEWDDRLEQRCETGAGDVRFEQVAVGAELDVTYAITEASGDTQSPYEVRDHVWRTTIAGPGAAVLRVPLAERIGIVVARLRTAHGPLRDGRAVRVESLARSRHVNAQTEDGGRFVMLFDRGLGDGPISASVRVAGMDGLTGFEIEHPRWGEVMDVGELTIAPGELALSGRVLSHAGTPVPGVTLALRTVPSPGDARPLGSEATSAGDGSFELRVAERLDEVTVVARAEQRVRSTWMIGGERVSAGPFPFGTRGVEIRLPAAGRIEVALRGRDGLPADPLEVRIFADRMPRGAVRSKRDPPSAVLDRVLPGTYDVVVSTTEGIDLSRVEDVHVVANATAAVEVVLPPLHEFEITVTDPDGRIVEEGGVQGAFRCGGRWRGSAFEAGVMRFLAPQPTLEFVVFAPGRHPARAELRPGATEIVLRRAPAVVLLLPELRAVAGDVPVQASLLPVEPTAGTRIQARARSLGVDGSLRVEFGQSGEHRLEVSIGAERGVVGSVDVDLETGTAVWTPAADWREVVQRLVAGRGR